MADEKKTQMGHQPGRTHRPTASQTPVAAADSPAAPPPAVDLPEPAAGTPVPGAAQVSKTSYLPPTIDPLIDATIAGRYRIEKKLGEGGMGTVYLATHNILEKQVALKVLHGEFARKPDLVERFIQEAKSASRIRHENVIDISDFGSTPEGLVFFAMELLTGHDLHDEVMRARVAGQLLPWVRTKRIFLQICAALAAAHAKGIVHRDLKPENVYLIDFLGDPDFVKLLDFGIAKLTEVGEEGGRKLTKTGMLFGTPEYMSPEQARGENVDHRVDVYAMGCILFQLVTGRVPFEAENFMGVLSMHLTEMPPQIAPETFDQIGAPRALAEVIDRALAKDRNERWQTIEDLANAVRAVSGDAAVADRPQRSRTPSVAAPLSTTRARPPTAPVSVLRESTGRVKTEWRGNLSVPEVAVDAGHPKSRLKLPLIVGAVVVLVGGGLAAIVATRGQSDHAAGNGSAPQAAAAIGAPTGADPAVTKPPPPPPPPEPKLPDMAKIDLDSQPHGATVTDLSTGKTLGKTPAHFSVPGSKTARQFLFHLHGYGDTTVEFAPDRDTITYVETLQAGATPAAAVHKVPDATPKPLDAPGTGIAKPGQAADPGGAVTRPDPGAVARPADPGTKPADPAIKPPDPATKPPDTTAKPPDKPAEKRDEDCPGQDEGLPCLKRDIKVH